MRQKLAHFACAFSLLLCVTIAALWVRSYWRSEAIVYSGKSGHRGVQWASGVLIFGQDNMGAAKAQLRLDSWDGIAVPLRADVWGRLGFGYERTVTSGLLLLCGESLRAFAAAPPATIISVRATVPFWLVFALSLAVPAQAAVAMLRRWRRRRSMRCVACGYDLRATPDRCPECGTTASVTPSPSSEVLT